MHCMLWYARNNFINVEVLNLEKDKRTEKLNKLKCYESRSTKTWHFTLHFGIIIIINWCEGGADFGFWRLLSFICCCCCCFASRPHLQYADVDIAPLYRNERCKLLLKYYRVIHRQKSQRFRIYFPSLIFTMSIVLIILFILPIANKARIYWILSRSANRVRVRSSQSLHSVFEL